MKRKFCDRKNIFEIKKMKADNILDQDAINYVLSLENMAIVNVAIGLCKQPDIRAAIWQHSLTFAPVKQLLDSFFVPNESVNQIEENILNKLSHLPLSDVLKVKVANIVRPIVLQILKWIRNGWNDIECLDSICWTTEGTIDRVRSLIQLAENDTGKHIQIIYKLACTYCIEDIIPNLWNKLPERVQKYYLCSKKLFETYDDELVEYWSSFFNNKLLTFRITFGYTDNNNYELYKKMFTSALLFGNCFAVKYFWKKLAAVDINNNLAQWVNDAVYYKKIYGDNYQDTNEYADILYFLLSKMNDKQQRKALQENCSVILISLFESFPCQKFLLPTMQTMWELIDENVYVQLLLKIAKEIKENKTTEKCFLELWFDSPVIFKRSFIQNLCNDSEGTNILCNLLAVENVGTIKLILNYANIEEQKQIACNLIENSKLFEVIYKSKFFLVDMFVEVLSEFGISSIKERIVFKDGSNLCLRWMHANNWAMVENFFSWAFSSQEQSDYFKNNVLNKIEIADSLVIQDNYESLNKFIDWCFASEQEGNEFKLNLLHCSQKTIFNEIVYRHAFEFVHKLISWCCQFNGEITNQYKSEFVLSDKWLCILKEFVWNCDFIQWESIRKLISLFSPLEADVISKLKKRITAGIEFYSPEGSIIKQKRKMSEASKGYLLRLIDDNN